MSREVATYGSGHIDCDARKAGNKKLRNHLFSNYGASVENRTSAASLRPEMICPNNCILAQSAVVVQPRMKRVLHVSTTNQEERINTSLAFWVDIHPELFTTSYGLTSGNNSQFLRDCYSIYEKRDDAETTDPAGFGYWIGVLNGYGDPASSDGGRHLIDAFWSSADAQGCRPRFGP